MPRLPVPTNDARTLAGESGNHGHRVWRDARRFDHLGNAASDGVNNLIGLLFDMVVWAVVLGMNRDELRCQPITNRVKKCGPGCMTSLINGEQQHGLSEAPALK